MSFKVMKTQSEADKKLENELREKLKACKERGRKREVKNMENMSEGEQKLAKTTQDAQREADRLKEDNALLSALKARSQVINMAE